MKTYCIQIYDTINKNEVGPQVCLGRHSCSPPPPPHKKKKKKKKKIREKDNHVNKDSLYLDYGTINQEVLRQWDGWLGLTKNCLKQAVFYSKYSSCHSHTFTWSGPISPTYGHGLEIEWVVAVNYRVCVALTGRLGGNSRKFNLFFHKALLLPNRPCNYTFILAWLSNPLKYLYNLFLVYNV